MKNFSNLLIAIAAAFGSGANAQTDNSDKIELAKQTCKANGGRSVPIAIGDNLLEVVCYKGVQPKALAADTLRFNREITAGKSRVYTEETGAVVMVK